MYLGSSEKNLNKMAQVCENFMRKLKNKILCQTNDNRCMNEKW